MKKQMPKYIITKLEKMNAYVAKAQQLAEEIEKWLEENEVTTDGYDYMYAEMDSEAYAIFDTERFIDMVNDDLASA